MTAPISCHDALQRLKDGNKRWVAGEHSDESLNAASRREALARGQAPFAVVLSCSDSRAPSEMLFDQGLGDLFVVRVAGNVVAPSLVGSVEFAVQTFGVGLVVVMGHTACGAVNATLDALLRGPVEGASANLLDIVQRIRPAVEPLLAVESDRATLVARATRANVRASMDQLCQRSPVLSEHVASGKLLVVGAEYALASGVVDFFEG
ncbi:MAG: carbonic anhydrase [Labilithrix sp.]|nr:carbonic anhydrase [Labilithrix sp.]